MRTQIFKHKFNLIIPYIKLILRGHNQLTVDIQLLEEGFF